MFILGKSFCCLLLGCWVYSRWRHCSLLLHQPCQINSHIWSIWQLSLPLWIFVCLVHHLFSVQRNTVSLDFNFEYKFYSCKKIIFRQIKKGVKEYFSSYWNWAEILMILSSFVAIGLYFYRILLVKNILNIVSFLKIILKYNKLKNIS